MVHLTSRRAIVRLAACVSILFSTSVEAVIVDAVLTSSASIPITAPGYTASGNTVNLSLAFAPATGTNLTIIDNTGNEFISGKFDNLAQGETVWLHFNSVSYKFVANYHGGTGNDLILQWAYVVPIAWGRNEYGALGDESTTGNSVPVAVTQSGVLKGKTVMMVAAGWLHSLALCSDGTVAAWGDNSNGQLGNGRTGMSTLPVRVVQTGALAGKTVVAVSAGRNHSLALCSDGTVATWGDQSLEPVLIPQVGALEGKTVVAVRGGNRFSLALCSDGTMASWGANYNGQLGNGSSTNSTTPVAVNSTGVLLGRTVKSIVAGETYGAALCTDGRIAQWGEGWTTPALLPQSGGLSGRTVAAVSAGFMHRLAVCSDGISVAWGNNQFGQYGNGLTYGSSDPVLVNQSGVLSGKTLKEVTAGFYHSVALCTDGTLAAWGSNSYGELGNGTTITSSVPVVVTNTGILSGKPVVALSTGGNHSLALEASPVQPDSTLRGLVLSRGKLSPTFDPTSVNYTTSVANSVAELSLTPEVSDPFAHVEINGTAVISGAASPAIPLVDGENTIAIQVTTADGSGTTHYTVKVFRMSSIQFTYGAVTSIPATVSSYDATGLTATFSLAFAPPTGTDLTVINHTGIGFIKGRFSNLSQGQKVSLTFNGVTYNFIANYYGGTGNDLILQWARREVVAWGYNYSGQLGNGRIGTENPPLRVAHGGALSGKTITSVSAGGAHSLAICSDGTVASWGRNECGQLGNGTLIDSGVPVAIGHVGALAGKTVLAVSAGPSYSLALCSDGTVAAWGDNYYGQLGIANATGSSTPVLVPGPHNGKTIISISAGGEHCLLLCSDGTMVGWGGDTYGNSPPAVLARGGSTADKTVVAIAAGAYHNLGLCSDGTVVAWGENNHGQLGNHDNNGSNLIVPVSATGVLAGRTVVAIAAGRYHSMALCSDGRIATWGLNYDGELGNGSNVSSNVPVLVYQAGALAGKNVVALAAGYFHNYALCSDGSIASWGMNDQGQLGDGIAGPSVIPVLVSQSGTLAGKIPAFVAAGSGHGLTICTDHTVVGWGDNGDGQLGAGTTESSRVPIAVGQTGILSGKTVVSTAVGFSHSLALCSDGTLAAWGSNAAGQLGNGTLSDSSFPVDVNREGVLAGKTVVAIGAGLEHSVALCSDGTLAAWGRNRAGQLGNGTLIDANVPTSVIHTGILAGKVVVSLAVGDYHNLVLCDDGTLAGWGSSLFGALGDGRDASTSSVVSETPVAVDQTGYLSGKSIVAIAAGGFHSVALCSDGTVAAWGLNTYSQLGAVASLPSIGLPTLVPKTGVLANTTIVKIAAGYNHTCALCADGTLIAWGANNAGQLGKPTATSNSLPVVVDHTGVLAGKKVSSFSTRSDHNLAVCTDGTVASWGYNRHGQLGNRTSFNSNSPTLVDRSEALSGKTMLDVAAGGRHSLGTAASPVSSDSTLAKLELGGIQISPTFLPTIRFYTANVPNSLTGLSITPTAGDSYAMIRVNDVIVPSGSPSLPIPLNHGTNIITISVNADNGTGSSDYTITVNKGGYNSWLAEHPALTHAEMEEDPDHDGIPNLLEYALNGNPVLMSPAILPTTSVDESWFRFTFIRRAESAADTELMFEYSTQLGSWNQIPITDGGDSRVTLGVVDGNGNQNVTIRIPKGTNESMFGRLSAHHP